MTDHKEMRGTVLIIDDDPGNLDVLVELLTDAGFETLVALGGEEGIERAEYSAPDIIVLDIMMPDMDGFETCGRLKQTPALKDIPVIFLSALYDEADIATGFDLGAADYITKPFRRKEILARVNAHVTLKRRKDALEFERVQYNSIFNSIPAIVDVVDPATHELLFLNQYAKDLLGGDYTGEKCHAAFHGADKPCSFCNNADVLADRDGTFQWEYYSDRLKRHFMTTNRAVRWPDGRDVKFELSFDITARKQLEDQLLQSQKLEAIGTLAGGVAHDFNNILFPIIGYAEMTLDGLPEGGIERRNVKEILDAAYRARDLVRQILTFSRKNEKELKPARLRPIVKEAVKLMRGAIPSTIEISEDIRDPGPVMADMTQIHQLIVNLCANAYHAMAEAGGTLEVGLKEAEIGPDEAEAHPDAAPGKYVKITVRDTGVGMAPEVAARIFEPYFTTKRKEEGTGLGLAVAAGIVRYHGGFIAVESAPGKGSVFRVFLPLIRSAAAHRDAPAPRPPQGGSERVLIVDDNAQVVEMMAQMLTGLGYDVTAKDSSADALDAFTADPAAFDLVITDMTMPHMTGDVLARKIMAVRPDAPVIICTGYSEKINDQKAQELGVKGFLLKPVIKGELARTIRRALG